MAILRAVTARSDYDFTNGNCTADTTSARIAPYANVGVNVPDSYSDPGGKSELQAYFDSVPEVWVQFHYYSTIAEFNVTRTGILFYLGTQVSGGTLFALDWNFGPNSVALIIYNGSSWDTVASVSTAPFSNSTRYRIDVHLKISDTDGIFRLYRNNILILDYVGDTLRTAATAVDKLWFRTPYTSTGSTTIFSGVIVADEDTRHMVFHQSEPVSDGANDDFVGAAASSLSKTALEIPPLALIRGDTGDAQTFVMEDIDGALSAYDVKAVVLQARVRRAPTAGAQNAEMVVRHGGTDYAEALPALEPDWQPTQMIYHNNPGTSAPWTQADVNAAEFGFKAVA